MAKQYKIPRLDGYHVQTHELMVKLGVEGAKWPAAGLEPRMVDGVEKLTRSDSGKPVQIKVWVKPFTPNPTRGHSARHRAMCECPGCGFITSVGRLHVHVCKEGVK